MKRHYCDKCGREVIESDLLSVYSVRIGCVVPVYAKSDYELCEDCLDKLNKWVQTKEEPRLSKTEMNVLMKEDLNMDHYADMITQEGILSEKEGYYDE